jgi:hypothetical protein
VGAGNPGVLPRGGDEAARLLAAPNALVGAVRNVSTASLINRKSEKGVFRRGHQKAGTAGFTPHTIIDAARLAVDEVAWI